MKLLAIPLNMSEDDTFEFDNFRPRRVPLQVLPVPRFGRPKRVCNRKQPPPQTVLHKAKKRMASRILYGEIRHLGRFNRRIRDTRRNLFI